MSELELHVDISDPMASLRRLSDGPDHDVTLRLDAVLIGAFQQTQALVHVITGSLRASGEIGTPRARRHQWRGEISYGGASGGFPNDPVRYASREQQRAGRKVVGRDWRGRPQRTPHDFMLPTRSPALDHQYTEAILDYLRGPL